MIVDGLQYCRWSRRIFEDIFAAVGAVHVTVSYWESCRETMTRLGEWQLRFEDEDPGLSRFGREVVQEMNHLGIVVDMSHSGERSTLEVIEWSGRPVAVTRADPRLPRGAARQERTGAACRVAPRDWTEGAVAASGPAMPPASAWRPSSFAIGSSSTAGSG